MAVLRRSAAAALALALAGCSATGSPSASRRLPDARLPTLAGVPGPSLASCPTDRCLTVLVAPWCGVCRAEAGNILLLRRFLDSRGVSSRIVVGLSSDRRAVKDFASAFGADALLDDGGVMSARATPLMLVTDREGRVLKSVEGFPSRMRGPDELARFLDLI